MNNPPAHRTVRTVERGRSQLCSARDVQADRIPLLAVRVWVESGLGCPRSHKSPTRERGNPHDGFGTGAIFCRFGREIRSRPGFYSTACRWRTGLPREHGVMRAGEKRGRSQSCSARRDVQAARIPLLALRAWMERGSHASPTREQDEKSCVPFLDSQQKAPGGSPGTPGVETTPRTHALRLNPQSRFIRRGRRAASASVKGESRPACRRCNKDRR